MRALGLLATLGLIVLALPGGPSARNAGPAKAQDVVPRSVWTGGAEFGASVAVSRNGLTAVVGDPGETRVRVFTRGPGTSTWRSRDLTGGAQSRSGFGTSVAISANGRVVLAGAPTDNRRMKGTAWIFRRSGGDDWVGQKLTARDEAGSAAFGFSVALSASGSTALVGGHGDSRHKGAVWVFERSGSTWRQQGKKLTGGREIGAGWFGRSVALSAEGDVALIGGPQDRRGLGAIWFFERSRSSWRQQDKLIPPNSGGRVLYGWDVALAANGKIALVGAPARRAAWILARSDSGWRHRPRPLRNQDADFGRSVALSAGGNSAAFGLPYVKSSVCCVRSGKAVVYSCSAAGCILPRELLAEDLPTDGGPTLQLTFGRDVAITDGRDTVIVTAPGGGKLVGNPPQNKERGKAYVFLKWPAVNRVRPNLGPESGGTEVSLEGENFTNVRQVLFGTTPAVRFAVQSSTRMTAVSPPGSEVVNVIVRTLFGTSEPRGSCSLFGCTALDNRFFYGVGPTVTAVTPSSGPTAGGTEVTIRGTDLAGGTVRFGARQATISPSSPFSSSTEIRVVSPTAPAGTVDVTVTTRFGTSLATDATRFSYVSATPERAITFDELDTGGPGGAGALVKVTSQYASRGVTFNDVSAIDYTKGSSAVPGFARSGAVAVEQCVGVEFCTSPIRGVLTAPQRLVRVWVGFSFRLDQPVQVELRALNSASTVLGSARATLPANTRPTPIGIPLEVRLAAPSITRFEVSIPGGVNNALAIDDVTLEG
jgi:IPT/TIG domain/FG-GAP repeat